MTDLTGAGRRLPVIVVGGFLGSGKTTLLTRRFAGPMAIPTAFVVNEFGDVGLDHRVVRNAGPPPTVISGGCVCCERRGALVETLRGIANQCDRGDARIEQVVIETSGLADPAPIASAIAGDALLRHRFVVDRVIVTVDAVNARADLGAWREARRQIATADMLVITKCDLVAPEDVEAVAAAIRQVNPVAPISLATDGEIEAHPRWPAVAGRSLRGVQPGSAACEHGDDIAAVCVSQRGPLEWGAFAVWLSMLLHARGDQILRVKGILDVEGDGLLAINGVQRIIHPPEHLPPAAEAPRTELVFITRGIAPGLIERSLATFNQLGSQRGR